MSTRPLELRDGKVVESIRVGTIGLPYFAECTFCHVEYHASTHGKCKGWAESHYWTKHKANEEKGQEVVASGNIRNDQSDKEPSAERPQSVPVVGAGNIPGQQREEFGDNELAAGRIVVGEGRVANKGGGQ